MNTPSSERYVLFEGEHFHMTLGGNTRREAWGWLLRNAPTLYDVYDEGVVYARVALRDGYSIRKVTSDE